MSAWLHKNREALHPRIHRLVTLVSALDRRLLDEICVVTVFEGQIKLATRSADLEIDNLVNSVHYHLFKRAAFEVAARASSSLPSSWTCRSPVSGFINFSCDDWQSSFEPYDSDLDNLPELIPL
ncbi:hypothetical protein R3P38DRAFT_2809275 [Favolaschia claudopus]|uniref:Uncharacterized protein n=1 Tax=Favolaschia claudopus TaxID=2862362 RepID=A0AAV9ZD96_9AGAR